MSDMDDPLQSKQEKAHADYVAQPLSADEYFADGEAAAQAASYKKRKQILIGSLGVLALLILFILYACQPPRGSMMYGICSAFLEQIVDYPPTVQHLYVEQFPGAVRIYFNQTDAFGQFTQNMIECIGDKNAPGVMRFGQVLYNRKPVDQALIDKFNKSIPVIVAGEPDLTLPEPPPNRLKSLPQ